MQNASSSLGLESRCSNLTSFKTHTVSVAAPLYTKESKKTVVLLPRLSLLFTVLHEARTPIIQ